MLEKLVKFEKKLVGLLLAWNGLNLEQKAEGSGGEVLIGISGTTTMIVGGKTDVCKST